jgi:hypothetical protein
MQLLLQGILFRYWPVVAFFTFSVMAQHSISTDGPMCWLLRLAGAKGHEYAHGSDRVIGASGIARWNMRHRAVIATRTALLRNVRATKQFHGPLGATGYFPLVINFRRATLSGLSSSAMRGWSTSATMISPTS